MTVRGRRLARLLREYRSAADLTQDAAAEAAFIGSPSKLSRIEDGKTAPRIPDLRALLDAYGVTDPGERQRAEDLARQAREPGWWHPYDLPQSLATYVALESEAVEGRMFENSFIPGLLQTPDYARHVISAGVDVLDSKRAEALVSVRMERQKLLFAESPLLLWAVIDEAVLQRQVGGPAVMRAQLQHLASAAEAGNVTVQVLRFSAGAHPGMTGAFTLLCYPEGEDHDILYADTPAGAVYAENPDDIDRAHLEFAHLTASAVSPGATIDLVRKYLADQ